MSGELLSGCTNQVEVTDLAIELEESINIISSYRNILREDAQLRTKLIAALKACVAAQEKEVLDSQDKIQECVVQLNKTEPLKVELKTLYEKLPPGPPNNDHVLENDSTYNQHQHLHSQLPKPPPPPMANVPSKRAQLQGETSIITPAKKIKAQHSPLSTPHTHTHASLSHHTNPTTSPPQPYSHTPLLPTPYAHRTHNAYGDVHSKQLHGYEINNAHHGTALYNNVTDHQMQNAWGSLPHMHP